MDFTWIPNPIVCILRHLKIGCMPLSTCLCPTRRCLRLECGRAQAKITKFRNHENYNMVKFLLLWKLIFNRFATTLQIYFLWFVILIIKLIYFSLCEESVKLIMHTYKNVLRNAVTIINERTKWLANCQRSLYNYVQYWNLQQPINLGNIVQVHYSA